MTHEHGKRNFAIKGESGFTLIELLVVMVLFMVIMGATLTTFDYFYRGENRNQKLTETIEKNRNGVDLAARQLRNLANQTPQQPAGTILIANDKDLVFQTADTSRRWMRYCLDTTNAGGQSASASRGQLWGSESTSATSPTAGMMGACPGTGWTSKTLAADYVTNSINGQDRNVFTYTCKAGAAANCPSGASDYGSISTIKVDLFVDPKPGSDPVEREMSSSIYLRNQNQKPTARATWTQVGSRTVIFNASGSTDPEGRTLTFDWFMGNATISLTSVQTCAASISSYTSNTYLGSGMTLRYTFPAAAGAAGTSVPVQAVSRDPGCLYDVTSPPLTVTIP